jgi:hypothetical protein
VAPKSKSLALGRKTDSKIDTSYRFTNPLERGFHVHWRSKNGCDLVFLIGDNRWLHSPFCLARHCHFWIVSRFPNSIVLKGATDGAIARAGEPAGLFTKLPSHPEDLQRRLWHDEQVQQTWADLQAWTR